VKRIEKESGDKKVNQFERFTQERENLISNCLIYLEPVDRFWNKSNVMTFRNFSDSTSSRL